MENMKRGILLGTIALILILGAVLNASAQSSSPAPAMQINNGETCTSQQQVTLNTNIQWKPDYSSTYKYRKGETPDLVNLPWKSMTGPNIGHTLSTGYGRKVVYLDVRNSNNDILPMNDFIDYKQSCVATQASIRDLQLTVVKAYPDRFKFDVKYDFYATRTDHDNTYQIEMKVIPEGHTSTTRTILGQKTFNYTASQGTKVIQGVEYRHFTGTLQVNAPAQGDLPFYRRLNFNVEVKGGPASKAKILAPLRGGEKSLQKFASKSILFVDESYNNPDSTPSCIIATGRKHDEDYYKQMRTGKGWMLGSIALTLNRARGFATKVGEQLKFDSNPMPGSGERGVRWMVLPNVSGSYVLYKIHWWCEPYSNKKEGNTYEFRFWVKYTTVEVKIL